MPLVYKYRSYANTEEQKRSHAIIGHRSLWFARADTVNDPFEFRFSLDFNSEASRETFAALEQMQNPGTTREAALRKVDLVLNGIPDWKKRLRQWDAELELWEAMCREFVICCFAGNSISPLMWSHYANGHRGICIEVEPPCQEGLIHEVVYRDRLPVFDMPTAVRGLGDDHAFRELFMCKAKCWEYEHEFRMSFPRREGGVAKTFPPGSIRRVIFGCAMPRKDRGLLARWMLENAPGVGAAIAGPASETSFEISVEDVELQELAKSG